MSWSVTTQEDVVLDEGVYDAIVSKLEKVDTKFGERVLWSFEVPGEETTVVGFTSLSPSNKSKAAKWARDILRSKETSINWGPEELEGKPCRVYVEVSEDADGFERNIVTKVAPPAQNSAGEHDDHSKDPTPGNEEDFSEIPF